MLLSAQFEPNQQRPHLVRVHISVDYAVVDYIRTLVAVAKATAAPNRHRASGVFVARLQHVFAKRQGTSRAVADANTRRVRLRFLEEVQAASDVSDLMVRYG